MESSHSSVSGGNKAVRCVISEGTPEPTIQEAREDAMPHVGKIRARMLTSVVAFSFFKIYYILYLYPVGCLRFSRIFKNTNKIQIFLDIFFKSSA